MRGPAQKIAAGKVFPAAPDFFHAKIFPMRFLAEKRAEENLLQ